MASSEQSVGFKRPVAAPTGLWARQFDPENDFPSTALKKKVALCTTPRCGSHFLGHQMHGRGCFGYPLEYLNPGNWQVWQKRAAAARSDDTFDYIKSVRTGPNGVFTTKLHHEHLGTFLMQEPDPLSYQFIQLRRRDLIKQAVSFARAQQTGAWISDMPETTEATYDWALIAAKVDAISLGNARWDAFLRSLGAVPLVLYYEDIREDMDGALGTISDYLNIDITAVADLNATFVPKRQKRAAQDDWAIRYVQDSRNALTAGRHVPGVISEHKAAKLGRKPIQIARRLLRKAMP